jgi:hypothetical protein
MAELRTAIDALPPEMQTLAHLATAPNAGEEIQFSVAQSIAMDTPHRALTEFIFQVIKANTSKNEEIQNGKEE